MAKSREVILPDDILIRRISQSDIGASGKPRPGALKSNKGRTSVYIERLLAGRPVPLLKPDDSLALIHASDVLETENNNTPLGVEHTSKAHAEIVGDMDQEYLVWLRDRVEMISPEAWIERQKKTSDLAASSQNDPPTGTPEKARPAPAKD